MNIKFKGIQKTTLMDFPGRISSVLFTAGCNFRCPFCHNGILIDQHAELPDIPADEILAFLNSRKKWLNGVVISGGEPTLWGGLIDFSKAVKDIGLLVKWDTNGTNPEMLEKGLGSDVVDFIAMDIKASPAFYEKASGASVSIDIIARSINIIKETSPEYEFRTTIVPGIHDTESLKEMAEFVGGGKRFCLQQFFPRGTLDSSFSDIVPYSRDRMERFRKDMSNYFDLCELRH